MLGVWISQWNLWVNSEEPCCQVSAGYPLSGSVSASELCEWTVRNPAARSVLGTHSVGVCQPATLIGLNSWLCLCFQTHPADRGGAGSLQGDWTQPGRRGTITVSSSAALSLVFCISRFKISISSEKLNCGWTLTTSQYTITHILYFKTQRTVIENVKVT